MGDHFVSNNPLSRSAISNDRKKYKGILDVFLFERNHILIKKKLDLDACCNFNRFEKSP